MLKTIKGKILLWNGIVLVATLIALEIFTYYSLKKNLYHKIDNILIIECRENADQLLIQDSQIHIVSDQEWGEPEHAGFGELSIYIQISSADGKIIKRSQNLVNLKTQLPLPEIPLQETNVESIQLNTHPFRKVDFPLFDGSKFIGSVTTAYLMSGAQDYLDYVRNSFFIITPICIFISLIGVRIISRNALTPISKIIATAQEIIKSGELSHRISEKKTDEELEKLISTLNELFMKLETSFRQIRNFSADASHELRIPLTIIRGNLEVILSRSRNGKEYRQTLETLLEEVIRMSNVVKNLLLVAQIDSDKTEMEMTIVKLDKLIGEYLPIGQKLAQSRKIHLKKTVETNIEIVGNKNRLNEMLNNLVENAVRYNKESGEVILRTYKNSHDAFLEVEDNGFGIPENEHKKIFDRFYRVNNTAPSEFGGSGLGLSIVKWIVEEHRGNISLESQPGKGTLFRVKIPLLIFEE